MFSDIKEFLSSFFKNLRSQKITKKSIWLIITVLLTILIPISIAICYTQYVKAEQKSTIPIISVSLFDENNQLIESDTVQEDIIETSPLASIFYALSSSKARIQKPSNFSENPNFNFKITYNSDVSVFKCYFSEDVKSSYIEDERGELYALNASDYSAFLASKYSETVYKDSVPPSLYTAVGDTVLPNQANWTYLTNENKETVSSNYESTEKIITYRITGTISFNFSRSPDACKITVKTMNDEIIFNGSLDELISLTAEENSELLVTVNAEWKKRNDNDSFGTQSYEFKIICAEPSTFALSSNEAFGGQLILITVGGVDSADSIIYSPLEALSDEVKNSSEAHDKALVELYNYKPIFVKESSNAYALLPIPANIPDTTFKFSLACGISKTDLTVNLKKSTSNQPSNESSFENISLTKAQKAEFSRIIFHLKHNQSDTLLLNEDFLFPTEYNFSLTHKYNTPINNSFTFFANSYAANVSDGMSVQSANIGVVSIIGTSPLLGNYVIVDHGMGLLTWYCGLSDVNVDENDIIKKGDVIGRAGSSSLLCENGVNIICSVGGILIDPASLVNDN